MVALVIWLLAARWLMSMKTYLLIIYIIFWHFFCSSNEAVAHILPFHTAFAHILDLFIQRPLLSFKYWLKTHEIINKSEVQCPNLKLIILYFLCFLCFLYFCIFILLYFLYFWTFSFGWTVHMNFHAKSVVCSSKNGWVIAVGTKEDTYIVVVYIS